MPKIKTKKSLVKRVKLTSKGTATHLRASRAHKLTKKSAARKRGYTQDVAISRADTKNVKKMLGI